MGYDLHLPEDKVAGAGIRAIRRRRDQPAR